VSIDRLRHEFDLNVRWVFFPLHPDTPAEGKSLEDLFPGRDLTPFRTRMQALMKEAGLPYGERTHTYNSRLAQELAKWAEDKLNAEALDTLHKKLYEAYFVAGANIGDTQVLADIAEQAGLARAAALEALAQRQSKQAIDDDWQKAMENGITGVPTFAAQDLVVVGCQPYEVLERFVLHLQSLNGSDQQAE
jgi:predicted DsbA family dithiol-disulfide isomerase